MQRPHHGPIPTLDETVDRLQCSSTFLLLLSPSACPESKTKNGNSLKNNKKLQTTTTTAKPFSAHAPLALKSVALRSPRTSRDKLLELPYFLVCRCGRLLLTTA